MFLFVEPIVLNYYFTNSFAETLNIACSKDVFRCLNRVFFTSSAVSEEWYAQKILKIISGFLSVSPTISVISHLILSTGILQVTSLTNSQVSTSRFLSFENIISGEWYDKKIPLKILDVRLSSIYRWCNFQALLTSITMFIMTYF